MSSTPMEVSAHSTTHCFSSSESSLLIRTKRFNRVSPISPARRSSRSLLRSSSGSAACRENRFKVLSSQQKEVPVLEAGSMNELYDVLAERILPTAAMASSPHMKYIVGIAGCPGAGKSTLASEVARRVNNLWAQKAPVMDFLVDSPEIAISLPMDGFHLYRHQLDKMEDPEEAHARRGAPWTFDPASLLKCLQKMKSKGSVYMPSFDHAVGDPVEDDIFVSPQHKVVIIEGNYLLLGEETWKEISSIFDEKWFIEADIDKAMQRVLKRFTSEMGLPLDIAKWRVEYNDRPNAELINQSRKNADLLIRSVGF